MRCFQLPVFAEMKCLLMVCAWLVFVPAKAEKDSTRWDFRAKGFDFDFGGSMIDAGERHMLNVLTAATPEERRSRYKYDEAKLKEGEKTYHPTYIRLSIVFSNNQEVYRSFFGKKELLFGAGLERYNDNPNGTSNRKLFTNIHSSQFPAALPIQIGMGYLYQSQYVSMGYQFASKPFFKRMALFSGVNARFGLNTYKQIEIYDDFASPEEENINAGYFSSGMHLGVKYNLSCDLNFFMRYEAGYNFYGGQINTKALFSSIGFGMRYKIIDAQDRPKYELMTY